MIWPESKKLPALKILMKTIFELKHNKGKKYHIFFKFGSIIDYKD